MSERKTAEIKFRIEPSVKARWQALAAEETDGNLSELISTAVQEHAWAKENQRRDIPLVLTHDWPKDEVWVVDMDKVGLGIEHAQPVAIIKNVTDASPANPVLLSNLCDCGRGGVCPGCSRSEAKKALAAPQEDVGTSDEVGAKPNPWPDLKDPKSWMFEGQNG